jgi:hypothetical protein
VVVIQLRRTIIRRVDLPSLPEHLKRQRDNAPHRVWGASKMRLEHLYTSRALLSPFPYPENQYCRCCSCRSAGDGLPMEPGTASREATVRRWTHMDAAL